LGAVGTHNPQWNASSIFYLKGEATMKQSKLIRKVYKACVDRDAEKQLELRLKEFAKIIKHKAEGKPFTHKWTVVQI
jgi:hypothetical protein